MFGLFARSLRSHIPISFALVKSFYLFPMKISQGNVFAAAILKQGGAVIGAKPFHSTSITCGKGAIKTRKSAMKRFKLTGKNKLKYTRSGKYHLCIVKSRRRLRDLRAKKTLTGTRDKNMKKLIPGISIYHK